MPETDTITYQVGLSSAEYTVAIDDDSIWINAKDIAEIIGKNLSEVESLLNHKSTKSLFDPAHFRKYDKGEGVQEVLISLDVVLHLATKTHSEKGMRFCMWASDQLKERLREKKFATVRERLELSEKRLDIQRKRKEMTLDIAEKKTEIRRKRLEMQKELLAIPELEKAKIALDEQRLLLDKATELSNILAMITVDETRTVVGSEPTLTPILDEGEREIVKMKLMDLILKF
ncbi:MAG: hypothetical protein J0L94_03965 [Rhodothermia bacterium]|nr:hypothetical protein [Rhodothermia bacterium]